VDTVMVAAMGTALTLVLAWLPAWVVANDQ
jgi:hypothetical protein